MGNETILPMAPVLLSMVENEKIPVVSFMTRPQKLKAAAPVASVRRPGSARDIFDELCGSCRVQAPYEYSSLTGTRAAPNRSSAETSQQSCTTYPAQI